jgi:hypothetical protein
MRCNVKLSVTEISSGCVYVWFGFNYPRVGSRRRLMWTFGSVKDGEILGSLNDCQLIKKHGAAWKRNINSVSLETRHVLIAFSSLFSLRSTLWKSVLCFVCTLFSLRPTLWKSVLCFVCTFSLRPTLCKSVLCFVFTLFSLRPTLYKSVLYFVCTLFSHCFHIVFTQAHSVQEFLCFGRCFYSGPLCSRVFCVVFQ